MWPILFAIGPVKITNFAISLILAWLFGSFVFWQRAREENYDEQVLLDLIFISTAWSFVGARLGYILIHFDNFGLNLYYWAAVWSKPGFFWLGWIGGILLAIIKFCREKNWELFEVLDLAVIGVSLSQAIVNLGFFFGGGTIGRVTQLPMGIVYAGLFEKRHPVGGYGFLLWLAGFSLLWWLEGKYRKFEWYQKHKGDARPGFLVFSYLIMLGLFGLILALVSEPTYLVYGVNMDTGIRLVAVMIGIGGLISRSGMRFNWNKKNWLKIINGEI